MNASSLTDLSRLLLDKQLLSLAQLSQAEQESAKQSMSLVRFLVRYDYLPSKTIAQALSDALGETIVDIDEIDPSTLPNDLVDAELLNRHEVLILAHKDGQVFIATSNPLRTQMISEMAFATNAHIVPVLVDETKLSFVMQSLRLGAFHDFGTHDDEHDIDTAPTDNIDALLETPTVKFVQKILQDAIALGASDIHFEPFEHHYQVRFRIDGVMQVVATPPKTSSRQISTRLKVMAQLDIAECRKPQDGRIKFWANEHGGKSIDFRISTTPTLFGEKIVLRLLDCTQAIIGMDALGMNDEQKHLYLTALKKSQGMILITGPTGSGKTISLYTGLGILNQPTINIQTVEDPVEIQLDGINQVNIHPKIGLDFAEVLRAFLRQDPDVIMVGEIRDIQTAEIAIKAAQTGHLVLSTLHTNSALDAVIRLKNMGVATFNIASSISLIIAQRLARRLCQHCKKPVQIPHQSLTQLGFGDTDIAQATFFEAVGCHACREGYRGRIGIYEVLPITPKLATLIMADTPRQELQAYANRQGHQSIRQSAKQQAMLGIISLQEMERLTHD
ncbi:MULTISPECIES: type IV-A pilus assembly ATPase PilB [unclassified Moraxella]|uniref:type IV-A pilus assembly ATPase PilB n=1 Tax=unclassified Moraxella TaxID=2685852 RepID=UPI00359EBC2F